MPAFGTRATRFRRAEGVRPLVLGHRGARHAAPENTMAAFELARQEGADGVELDVRLTGDRRIVVLHDPDLTRVTNGRCRAHSETLTAEALRALDVGGGERAPLLSDVLQWAKELDSCLNIEVKADVRQKGALLDALVLLLKGHREAEERLLLSSFHPWFVYTLARRLPRLPVSWLVHRKQTLLRFAPGYRALGASGVNPEHVLLSVSNIEAWHRQGALVGTWTVNDPELAVAYANFGVDALISDTPGKILNALSAEARDRASTV